jgi:uncharacterized RDD family membrane protein YckC
MSVGHPGLLARRIAAGFVDFSLELGSGLLGSYFGAMLAALVVAIKNQNPEAMQTSIWNGFGFGFVFWALSISFLNRALIQGVSRSSIGKKIFKLELISCGQPLTWGTVMKRWVLGILSSIGGLGYSVIFFNREGRAFHDFLTNTDVVPIFEGRNMSVEHDEKEISAIHVLSPSFSEQFASRVLVLANSHAERPSVAPVIQLPIAGRSVTQVETPVASAAGKSSTAVSLADVIDFKPRGDAAAKEKIDTDEVQAEPKKVA